jgi:hypothetical protein
MATQKTKAWDVIQNHPIAGKLELDAQLALLCEYVDLYDDLQGMSLAEFIDSYFAADAGDGAAEEAADEPADEPVEEEDEGEPSSNGDGVMERPKSMVGMRIVYRFVGRNVLSDEEGVTHDSGGTVSFTDVDGDPWSNIRRDHVWPIDPANYREVHVSPREAKEITAWLDSGAPVKGKPEGEALRNFFVEFDKHSDRIMFVVMNGKRPYVDRFVQKPNGGFEDDQKPITRLLGEHCFRVQKKDYVVSVVSP